MKLKGIAPILAGALILLILGGTYLGANALIAMEDKAKLEASETFQIYEEGNAVRETDNVIITEGCTGKKVPIENMTVNTMTKYANSYSADSSGAVKAFGEFANPLDANANPATSASLASGTSWFDGKILKTDTNYRWIYDGAGTYYGVDLDVFDIDYCNAYSEDRGLATFPVDPIVITEIGTISDMGDEADWNQTDDVLYCNGQSSNVGGPFGNHSSETTTELYGNDTADKICKQLFSR